MRDRLSRFSARVLAVFLNCLCQTSSSFVRGDLDAILVHLPREQAFASCAGAFSGPPETTDLF